MNLVAAIQAFFTTEVGLTVQGVAALAAADFLTGAFAAIKDGTFQWDALAAWVRKHLGGRVLPIFAMLFLGHFAGQPTLLIIGIGAAAAYTAETLMSIKGNFFPPKEDPTPTKAEVAAEVVNPVPVD